MFLTSHPSLSIDTDTTARTGESGSSSRSSSASVASGSSDVTSNTCSAEPSMSDPMSRSRYSVASSMVDATRNITGSANFRPRTWAQ